MDAVVARVAVVLVGAVAIGVAEDLDHYVISDSRIV